MSNLLKMINNEIEIHDFSQKKTDCWCNFKDRNTYISTLKNNVSFQVILNYVTFNSILTSTQVKEKFENISALDQGDTTRRSKANNRKDKERKNSSLFDSVNQILKVQAPEMIESNK